MHLKAYTTANCFYCDQLKLLLERIDPQDQEITVDLIKIIMILVKSIFNTNIQTLIGFPYIVVDDEHIGGLVETAKLLLRKGFCFCQEKMSEIKINKGMVFHAWEAKRRKIIKNRNLPKSFLNKTNTNPPKKKKSTSTLKSGGKRHKLVRS